MSVTAVIRAYNEEAHLGRLLHGLQAQTVPVDEVILVDSGSSDRTIAIADAAGCKVVNIAKEEFSFGRSLNYGCEAATGEHLLIVSAHVYPVYDTFVERLLAPMDDPETALVYGRQVGDHRTKFSESRVLAKWFPETSIRNQTNPFSNNANAMVRRSVWEELRYDEKLTGLEDIEFAKRAIEQGRRVDYVAEAPVVHVHEETWQAIRNRYRREAMAYKEIMDEQEFTGLQAVFLAGANIASDYWHAARARDLSANLGEIPKFRIAQFLGAVEGFRTPRAASESLRRRFYYPDLSPTSRSEPPGDPIDYPEVG